MAVTFVKLQAYFALDAMDWTSSKTMLKTALAHPFDFASTLLSIRWIRFGIMGAIATVTYYLLGIFFVPVLGLPLLAGNTLAFVISFIISYLGHLKWTFRSQAAHMAALPRFAATQGIALVFNSIIVEGCNRASIPYEISMLIAISAVPVITYLILKFWVFREKERR